MKRHIILFCALTVMGIIMLLSQLGYIAFGFAGLMGITLIVVSFYMHAHYLTSTSGSGAVLIPAGTFLILGLIFFVTQLFNNIYPKHIVGLLFIAPAAGIFEYMMVSGERELIAPVSILLSVGLLLTLDSIYALDVAMVVSLAFILFGVLGSVSLIYINRGKKKQQAIYSAPMPPYDYAQSPRQSAAPLYNQPQYSQPAQEQGKAPEDNDAAQRGNGESTEGQGDQSK